MLLALCSCLSRYLTGAMAHDACLRFLIKPSAASWVQLGDQPSSGYCLMAQHTLIVAVPKDATTLVSIEADSTEELFRIGREMFPRHRCASGGYLATRHCRPSFIDIRRPSTLMVSSCI